MNGVAWQLIADPFLARRNLDIEVADAHYGILLSAKRDPAMSTIPVQEIKRRGMSVVDEALTKGPVHLVRSNRAQYVVMSEEDYQQLMNDLAEARLAASEADLRENRVRRGDAKELMQTLRSEE